MIRPRTTRPTILDQYVYQSDAITKPLVNEHRGHQLDRILRQDALPRVSDEEYLRRAAWWARATNSQQWPFFDIAAAVNPSIRADPAVERVTAHLQN